MTKLFLLAAALAAPTVALATSLPEAVLDEIQLVPRARQAPRKAPSKRRRPTPPAAAPAPPEPAPVVPHERRPGIATVTYATARRAYLDTGTRGGLASGAEIRLERGGRPGATCRLEVVGENEATCVGTGVRVGDTVALQPPPAPPPPRPLPPLVAPAELARRRVAMASVVFQKVDFKATQASVPMVEFHGSEISLGHATWAAYGAGPTQLERLDVALRGVPVAGGIRAYLDLTAQRWTRRDGSRFRPDEQNQLYVWEAELAARDPGNPLVLSLGRVRPWSAPGATIFDGAQAGWRPTGRSEIGIFGGGIPDPQTLSPTLARRTGGLYLALEQSGRSGILVREEARLAAVQSPELGRRLEAEAEGQVYLGRAVQGSANLRFGIGDSAAPGKLDAARVDLSLRPVDRVALLGSYRYVGLDSAVLSPTGVATGLAPSRHADLAVAVDPTSWLTVSAAGGHSRDLSVGVQRNWFGPELSLPRLLGGRASVGAGWHEETGWVGGRDVFLQLAGQPTSWLRLLSRFSYFRDTHTGNIPGDEGGLFLNAAADLAHWLSLRLSVLTRISLRRGDVAPGSRADGLAGQVDLVGSY